MTVKDWKTLGSSVLPPSDYEVSTFKKKIHKLHIPLIMLNFLVEPQLALSLYEM